MKMKQNKQAMEQNYHSAAQLLLSHDNILILSHKNPDGDTLCSSAALCAVLRRAGKTVYLYPNPQITERYRPYAEQFLAPEGFAEEYTVSVDVAAEDMFAKGFTGQVDFCIDHHPTNPHFGEDNLVCPEKSATGEIILAIAEELTGDLTPQEADLLYIAVSTDTGCFQYANTNADTFRAVAKLTEYGARNADLNVKFFRKVSKARLLLEGMIFSGMKFYREGKIVISTVTLEMMEKCGATEDDCDDLAALPGRAEGEIVGVTIREREDGTSKISLRTTKDVSSIEICGAFGGGGHAMAAGCTIPATPEKAAELLLAKINEVYK